MAVNFPSNPLPGDKYTNPDTGVTYQWKPSTKEWIATGSSEQFQTIISDDEPLTKNPGALWFQPNERILYVYNGESAQWEAIVNPIEGGVTVQGSVDVTSAEAPTDPENGWLYVQTASGVVCPSGWTGIIGNPTHVGQFVLYGADDGNARWFLGGTTDEIGDKFLPLDGGTMRGGIDMNGSFIKNAKDPTSDGGVGTRGFNDLRYVQVLGDDMDGPLRFGGSGILQSKNAPNVYVSASDAWYVKGTVDVENRVQFSASGSSPTVVKFAPGKQGQRTRVDVEHHNGTSAGGLDIRLKGDSVYNMLRILGKSGASSDLFKIKSNGDMTIGANLQVDTGTVTFKEHVTFEKTALISGDLVVGAAVQIGSTLQVNSAALFQSSIDLDGYLKVGGNTTLSNTLTVNKKATFKRVGDATDGFVIEGNPSGGKLFYVYHNSGGTLDAVNYKGKDTSNDNIMNRAGISALIDSKITAGSAGNATINTRGLTFLGQANIGTSTNPSLKAGQLYFNSNQNTLIIGT